MATIEDVARLAAALPEVTEGERRRSLTWYVREKAFAWDRPFTKADRKRYGDETPPDGPIVAVRVADLIEKEAVLTSSSPSIFTIPHFDGFAAVLIHLQSVRAGELRDAITDAWLACAPPKLAKGFLTD